MKKTDSVEKAETGRKRHRYAERDFVKLLGGGIFIIFQPWISSIF
jgi:hypothetical protein